MVPRTDVLYSGVVHCVPKGYLLLVPCVKWHNWLALYCTYIDLLCYFLFQLLCWCGKDFCGQEMLFFANWTFGTDEAFLSTILPSFKLNSGVCNNTINPRSGWNSSVRKQTSENDPLQKWARNQSWVWTQEKCENSPNIAMYCNNNFQKRVSSVALLCSLHLFLLIICRITVMRTQL